MNTIQKKDYFEEIIAYDDRVQQYVAKTHAKIMKEHLKTCDLMEEMQHLGYIWHETKSRFNKLMQEKIMEIGYNPKYSEMGGKSYHLAPSYLHKSKDKIEKAKARYMQNAESYTSKNKYEIFKLHIQH